MVPDDDIGHWRKEAEGYLGSAGVLFRKGRYPQMLHHCYFAAQSALKASFFARHTSAAPDAVNLVVIADEVSRDWTVAERELLLELTECARAIADGGAELMTLAYTKERCMRNLMMTAGLVSDLGQ